MNRILWNQRPPEHGMGGNIDEIVLEDARTVHVEQMGDRCWWIGITLDNGGYWSGNFTCDSRGRMRFTQQDADLIAWDRDNSHEDPRR